jgi:hypothetical protein
MKRRKYIKHDRAKCEGEYFDVGELKKKESEENWIIKFFAGHYEGTP